MLLLYKRYAKFICSEYIKLYLKFWKKYNIIINSKSKNYLFDQIFEFHIEKNIFDFQEEDILNTYVKYGNLLTDDERYYFRQDIKKLFSPYIENFEKNYDIEFDPKIKNYLFYEIFKIQIEENIFDFEDKNIYNILLNI